MKIGFILHRTVQFKVFASVIDVALQHGADVMVLYNNMPEGKVGSKAYQWPNPLEAPAFQNGTTRTRSWQTWDELVQICIEEDFDVVVSQWIKRDYHAVSRRVRERGIKWLSLQHSYEHLAMRETNFTNADMTCLYSDYWIDRTLEVLEPHLQPHLSTGQTAEQFFKKIVSATGFPELDQAGMIDRDEVRKRLRIPAGKPVVLYISYGLMWQAENQWEDLILLQPNQRASLRRILQKRRFDLLPYARNPVRYDDLLHAVRAFCDHNDAFLISKSRIKDAPPLLEMQLADYHTFDQRTYPHTILELLAIADLVIHPISTVGLEAVFMHVPAMCLMPPLEVSQAGAYPHSRIFEKLEYNKPYSVFNFENVSYPMDMLTMPDVLPHADLSDFSLEDKARSAYVQKFLGFDDFQSADRVWKELESLHE